MESFLFLSFGFYFFGPIVRHVGSILCVYDVSWDCGGHSAWAEGKKVGKAIESLAEKGISCAQKRIRPLAPY